MQHAPHLLSVQLWDAPAGADPVEAHDVWPGGDAVALSAGFDAPVERERGEVFGRVEDAGLRLASDAALVVHLQVGPGSWMKCRDVENGCFCFKDSEPGAALTHRSARTSTATMRPACLRITCRSAARTFSLQSPRG